MADDGSDSSDSGFNVNINAEIKTEIPQESSGRALDALVDLIRPFSEWAGLKGDQIRLQREEVLIEIAMRAQEKLALKGKAPSATPTKFLVPFLENASRESIDDDTLKEAWAALLADASVNYNSLHIQLSDTLSRIGHREILFLCKLIESGDSDGQERRVSIGDLIGSEHGKTAHLIEIAIREGVERTLALTDSDVEELLLEYEVASKPELWVKRLRKIEVFQAAKIYKVSVRKASPEGIYSKEESTRFVDRNFTTLFPGSIVVLEQLGLIRSLDIRELSDGWFLYVSACVLTDLGRSLMEICGDIKAKG